MKIIEDILKMTIIKLIGLLVFGISEMVIIKAFFFFMIALQFDQVLQVVALQIAVFGTIWGVTFGSSWQKRKVGVDSTEKAGK